MQKIILIVDDDAEIRECFALALSTRHYPVKICPDRENGILLLKRDSNITCILLDYNMPGMSAEEFVEQAKGIKPDLGIILITATDNIATKAKRLKVEHYLQKPVDFEDLYREVSTVCCDAR